MLKPKNNCKSFRRIEISVWEIFFLKYLVPSFFRRKIRFSIFFIKIRFSITSGVKIASFRQSGIYKVTHHGILGTRVLQQKKFFGEPINSQAIGTPKEIYYSREWNLDLLLTKRISQATGS